MLKFLRRFGRRKWFWMRSSLVRKEAVVLTSLLDDGSLSLEPPLLSRLRASRARRTGLDVFPPGNPPRRPQPSAAGF